METVHDVAAAVLTRMSAMTTMKLQKLVYYTQAWSLVELGHPAFEEDIQAWANGPVVYELFDRHRGKFVIDASDFPDAKTVPEDVAGVVDRVVAVYGPRSAQDLSEQTHAEAPWRDVREGLPSGARSKAVISHSALFEFYSQQSLP